MLCSCGKETNNIKWTTDTANTSFAEERESDGFTYEVYDTYIKITGCNSTESVVTIPEAIDGKSVTVLGEDSFYQKTKMTEIHLPSGIEIIEKGAFYRCYALTYNFTAAHRFSKTHYYIIKIQSYNNTNRQFINCPYNLVGADSIRPQHQLPKRGNTTIPPGLTCLQTTTAHR